MEGLGDIMDELENINYDFCNDTSDSYFDD
jgi:hypothetical protein